MLMEAAQRLEVLIQCLQGPSKRKMGDDGIFAAIMGSLLGTQGTVPEEMPQFQLANQVPSGFSDPVHPAIVRWEAAGEQREVFPIPPKPTQGEGEGVSFENVQVLYVREGLAEDFAPAPFALLKQETKTPEELEASDQKTGERPPCVEETPGTGERILAPPMGAEAPKQLEETSETTKWPGQAKEADRATAPKPKEHESGRKPVQAMPFSVSKDPVPSGERMVTLKEPEKIARVLEIAARENLPKTVELRMEPEGLGPVKVLLSQKGEKVSVRFLTVAQNAQRVLFSQVRDLQQALSQHGMTLSGFGVDEGGPSFGEAERDRPKRQRDRRDKTFQVNKGAALAGSLSARLDYLA